MGSHELETLGIRDWSLLGYLDFWDGMGQGSDG